MDYFFKETNNSPRYFCILLTILTLLSPKIFAAKAIRVLTGPLPPYSYEIGQKHAGLVTEVFLELNKITATNIRINQRPWPRAIKESKQKRTVIYPFARTAYRENDYLWLGPVTHAYHVMVVPASNLKNYDSLLAFKKLNVAVLRNAPPHKMLKKKKFENLTPLGASSSIAKMLKINRIEAWYDAKSIIEYHINANNIEASNFRVAFVDEKMSFYIGFSKDLKDEFKLWKKAFDQIKKNGKLKQIQEKYQLEVLK